MDNFDLFLYFNFIPITIYNSNFYPILDKHVINYDWNKNLRDRNIYNNNDPLNMGFILFIS